MSSGEEECVYLLEQGKNAEKGSVGVFDSTEED